jgi:hypothetical protein
MIMNLKENNGIGKQRKNKVTKALYIAAAVIAVFGVAMLADNIYIFKSTLNQYAAQGYPLKTVLAGLLPQQLLPGIFEPIALYGGIACALFGIGSINKKLLADRIASETENEQVMDAPIALGEDEVTEEITASAIETSSEEESPAETAAAEDAR